MKRKLLTFAALTIVALAAVLILTRPDPGHDMFTAYRDIYPGTPASAEAVFIAKAEQICHAGAPASWWATWDNGAPARADLWNLAIEHMCPQYAAHMVTTP